jgi:uncharacterized protein
LTGAGLSSANPQTGVTHKILAEKGRANGQFELGVDYLEGRNGFQVDKRLGMQWVRRAADQGLAIAQHHLGDMYFRGDGTVQDYEEAVKWFEAAADQKFSSSLLGLAMCYEFGKGVKRSNLKAHMYYNLAAALYDDESSDTKIFLSETRDEVAKDMSERQLKKATRMARKWLEKRE